MKEEEDKRRRREEELKLQQKPEVSSTPSGGCVGDAMGKMAEEEDIAVWRQRERVRLSHEFGDQ